MAIQRIIDEDRIPYDGDGKRVPLNLDLEPNYTPAPQPVEVLIRGRSPVPTGDQQGT
jgi:hypothetical protein